MKLKQDHIFVILIIVSILIATFGYLPGIFDGKDSIFKTHFGNDDPNLDSDYTRYFLPFYESTSESVEDGEFPIWDSDRNIALFGGVVTAFPYPIYLLDGIMPTSEVFMISIILHLLLAGISVYFVARKHFKVSELGSYSAAIIYALCGQSLYFSSTGHADMFHGVALLPLTLYFILNLFKAEDNKKLLLNSIVIGTLLGIIFLIGAITFIFNIIMLMGAILIYLLIEKFYNKEEKSSIENTQEKPWKKPLSFIIKLVPYLFLIIILMFLLSAGKIIAFSEFSTVSDGHDVMGFSDHALLDGSFHPTKVVPFMVLPNIFSITPKAH